MAQLWWCVVGVLACAAHAAAVMGGAPAAAPEPDAAVVFVQRHGRSSRLQGMKNDKLGYYSFMGIRYAEPPVGQRRFQRPIRRFLFGEVLAHKNCLPCPQAHPTIFGKIIGHEDCLCLNVYAPKMPGDERGSPVVFFIHGGNYRSGSIASYGGQYLTQKDTVLVTAQYRLGSLGFLSTGKIDASGNAGLFDLKAAMTWINDYIEFFGGDPTRVVVMGQGSGGSTASLLALSHQGRSATGVAALSGAPLSPGAIRPDPEEHARTLANSTGCPASPPERLMLCLRKLSIDKIVLADSKAMIEMVDTKKFLDEISGRSGAGARVEGEDDLRGLPPFVTEDPETSLKRKPPCPLLTGVTSAETSRVVFGKYSKFLSQQLRGFKDFIKKELIGGLRDVIHNVQGLIPAAPTTASAVPVLPLAEYYQALFDNSMKAVDGLVQIAEATGDALFNFPAYQSILAWSAGGPAYLYSFEHQGNLSKGWHFLPGVPLAAKPVDSSEKAEAPGPAHGDELAYIFEPLDEDGNPLEQEVSSTDARVRGNFVSMIAKFAHDLSPVETKANTKLLGLIPFSKKNDQFIKIREEISLDKNFRFCQMGLWGNMVERVTGSLCQNLFGGLLNITKMLDPIKLTQPITNVLGNDPNRKPGSNPLLAGGKPGSNPLLPGGKPNNGMLPLANVMPNNKPTTQTKPGTNQLLPPLLNLGPKQDQKVKPSQPPQLNSLLRL